MLDRHVLQQRLLPLVAPSTALDLAAEAAISVSEVHLLVAVTLLLLDMQLHLSSSVELSLAYGTGPVGNRHRRRSWLLQLQSQLSLPHNNIMEAGSCCASGDGVCGRGRQNYHYQALGKIYAKKS
jgi:hypothetical protein